MSTIDFFLTYNLELLDNDFSEALRVRHQVYCEELGYEEVTPEKKEQDKYDAKSWHFLIRETIKDIPVATFRAVPKLTPSQKLPLESITECKEKELVVPSLEVSRLCVLKDYRNNPLIPLCLYLAAKELADASHIFYIYCVMQPRLARHVKRGGFDFVQETDFFDLHGKRALYSLDTPTQRKIPEIEALSKQVKKTIGL
jgi:N-acyl-L-homoserine lactone synthetase